MLMELKAFRMFMENVGVLKNLRAREKMEHQNKLFFPVFPISSFFFLKKSFSYCLKGREKSCIY